MQLNIDLGINRAPFLASPIWVINQKLANDGINLDLKQE